MAWIESHQELGRHPKTRKAARLLGVSRPAVVGHLHYLWWWATDFAQDGMLNRYEADDIADAALWDGDPDLFISALFEAGFLDQALEGLHIHDWDEYAGRLIEKRKANAERMRTARAAAGGTSAEAQPQHESDTSRTRATHVQRTYHARAGATVQYPTEPDQIPAKAGTTAARSAAPDALELPVLDATEEPVTAAPSPSQSPSQRNGHHKGEAPPSDLDAPPPVATPAPAASKPKKPPRELSPDHQYRAALLTEIEALRGGEKPPNKGREWDGAGQFYRREVPLETAVACYREEMRRPKWDSEYLSLTELLGHIAVYVKSPANYRAAIERARKAASGGYEAERAAAAQHNSIRASPARAEPQPGLRYDDPSLSYEETY